MPDPDAVKDLFNRCTAAEVEELMRYFHTAHEKELSQLILNELEEPGQANGKDYRKNLLNVYARIEQSLPSHRKPIRRVCRLKWI